MCWKVEYILLIIISTLIDYSCGIAISGAGKNSARRVFLLLSLITNLGFLFSFKYYNFFSGYSDIATGTARIPGVELMTNFNRPYHSKSIHEFWSRWHISLSTSFRDYLYIPLGGNRVSGNRWMVNILIVFVVSGLWHGANWTFVVWGFIHGAYLLIGRIGQGVRDSLSAAAGLTKTPGFQTALKMLITFHLVLL